MAKKLPTKEDKAWFAAIRELGCVVCSAYDVQVHHLTNAGMGLRSDHQRSIPLCKNHHLDGGWGVAVHAGVKEFEKRYGTQEELLAKTRELLNQ